MIRESAVRAVLLATFASLVIAVAPARAEDLPTFKVEMKDGVITPLRIEVPADKPFKIELHNTGTTPAEFESIELRKEKVVAPGAVSFVVIKRVSPGEYKFFDDFHPTAPQVTVVAK